MAQQSILSFFNSPATATAAPAAASSAAAARVPPPMRRLVPPPSSPASSSATTPPPPPPPPPSSSAATSHPGTIMRSGGSPAPNLDLAPITPAWGRAILLAAGAEERPVVPAGAAAAGTMDLVFAAPSTMVPSASPRIVYPRDEHVSGLVSVNGILLPVRYPDSFYRLVTDRTRLASLFNRVLLSDDNDHNKKVVGGIVCRLEPSPFVQQPPPPSSSASSASSASSSLPLAVYIQSLALLSPHRGHGLAAAALDSIVATAVALNQAARQPDAPSWSHSIQTIYAHVWTENEDALRWYEARGFRRHGDRPVDNYYFKLRPNTAWLLRRDLGVAEQVAAATKTTAAAATQAAPPTVSPTAAATATATARPPPPPQSQSYQNARPATEWNDLPEDMVIDTSAASSRTGSRSTSRQVSRQNLLVPPTPPGTAGGSTSSRSSSRDGTTPPPASASAPPPASRTGTTRKKRERAYPAAMFQQ